MGDIYMIIVKLSLLKTVYKCVKLSVKHYKKLLW